MTRAFLDPLLIYVSVLGLSTAVLTLMLVRRPFESGFPNLWPPVAAIMASALVTEALAGGDLAILALALVVGLLAGTAKLVLPRLSGIGALQVATMPVATVIGTTWGLQFLAENAMPQPVMIAAYVGAGIGIVTLGFTMADMLVRRAVFTHEAWRRPNEADPTLLAMHRPKVSIHLPAYAEPPEIVISVLDRLSRLDYPDYEVLVCDNNTADPALWKPVEAHCARLNARMGEERFRFFHVAPLAGAKAGACNWLLDRVGDGVELIAVIDADYRAEPDFLSRLAGHFVDPKLGYIQTPHDYRDYEGSTYLDACYWEYMPNNKVELAGLNEYGAAYTIGTMCVIRREALEKAGRWAEWCLTEDSEVSVRIRSLGYTGLFFNETFGRGLIPATFEDYKKQRFRWCAGPVQQLRRHWRLYLPRWLGGTPSQLDSWSRLLELLRGIGPVTSALALPLGVIGWIAFMGLTAAGLLPVITVPDAVFIAGAFGIAAAVVARYHLYKLTDCDDIGAMLRGELARLSLTWVQFNAALGGLSKRPLAWRRTPKFGADGRGLRALDDVKIELAIGTALIAFSIFTFAMDDMIGDHLSLLSALGGLYGALHFLAAPMMAWINERELAAQEVRQLPNLDPVPVLLTVREEQG